MAAPNTLSFLSSFRKQLDKVETISTSLRAPDFWYDTGNLSINKIMSGSFRKGIPQGRITTLAGPSGSGKSFVACNILKHAQQQGAFILALDSENALDKNFLSAIGVDVSEDKLQYVAVSLFSDVVKVLSEFLTSYEKAYGKDNKDSPKVVILLDSLDMLITSTELDHFDGGVQKGDQGQRAKQAKHMLRTMVNRISRLPIAFLVTHQVYSQDIMLGDGPWAVNNAVKYSASQILLITKLKLKEDSEVVGIRMRVECYKSRFAKLGSKVEVEVPYSEGMNPYSGFIEMLEAMGILTKAGYSFCTTINGEDIKFQRKALTPELVEKLLQHPILLEEERTVEKLMAEVVEEITDAPSTLAAAYKTVEEIKDLASIGKTDSVDE